MMAVIIAIGLWLVALIIAVPVLIDSTGVTPTAAVVIVPSERPSTTASSTATVFPSATVSPTAIPSSTSSPTVTAFVQATISLTDTKVQPAVAASFTSVATNAVTATQNATSVSTSVATNCAHPAGWMPYQVADGDTLFGFVMGAGGSDKLSIDSIMQGNCLSDRNKALTLGQLLYLPAGIGAKSPKIQNGAIGGTLLPAGAARTANCPCTISIAAGWRLEQIAAAIDATPVGFSGRDFLTTTAGGVPISGFDFLASKPPGASLEGFMAAGTYTLSNTTTAANFRDMLLSAFGSDIPGSWRDAANGHGGLYNAVILASIIQRESTRAADQPIIASVFYNRLNVGSTLASSVTLQYALGTPGDWWPSISASAVHSDSPYNTLKHKGLPPTPIDSPGLGALQAAIYPASSPYIYFAASCTGPGEDFSQTYAEFQAKLQACGG